MEKFSSRTFLLIFTKFNFRIQFGISFITLKIYLKYLRFSKNASDFLVRLKEKAKILFMYFYCHCKPRETILQ